MQYDDGKGVAQGTDQPLGEVDGAVATTGAPDGDRDEAPVRLFVLGQPATEKGLDVVAQGGHRRLLLEPGRHRRIAPAQGTKLVD